MEEIELDEILRLERSVWDALVAGDPVADEQMLSADFLGVYKSGFSDRQDHADQLRDGPTVERYELEDCRLIRLGPGLVLLAYRADYVRVRAGPSRMYVSSIWRKIGGNWTNIFSQDTDAEGAANSG